MRLPRNLEAEQSVLGACLLDESGIGRAVETGLKREHFYRLKHSAIFGAMLELWQADQPCDPVILSEKLKRTMDLDRIGGSAYLSELLDGVGTAANIEHYCNIVIDQAMRRQMALTGRRIEATACSPDCNTGELLDMSESEVMAVRGGMLKGNGRDLNSEHLRKVLSGIEDRAKGRVPPGITSGLTGLDLLTAGAQPSDLIVLAARPAMGKSALGLQWALTAAIDSRIGAVVFSLEMPYEQLILRLLAQEGGINVHKLRTGHDISEGDWNKLTETAGVINGAPLVIDDTAGLGVMELRARARRYHQLFQKQGTRLGLVVVDYLQLLHGQGENREQEIAGITRGLKGLAKELNAPVLALSQLNRKLEDRTDKRPKLADLRESGAIEQDADVVIFIYRDEVYNARNDNSGRAELIVAKQRNGPTGSLNCAWIDYCAVFRNLEKRNG